MGVLTPFLQEKAMGKKRKKAVGLNGTKPIELSKDVDCFYTCKKARTAGECKFAVCKTCHEAATRKNGRSNRIPIKAILDNVGACGHIRVTPSCLDEESDFYWLDDGERENPRYRDFRQGAAGARIDSS
jgi:hypothetical protein